MSPCMPGPVNLRARLLPNLDDVVTQHSLITPHTLNHIVRESGIYLLRESRVLVKQKQD